MDEKLGLLDAVNTEVEIFQHLDKEIEILFRVPSRILQQVKTNVHEKNIFGIAFEFKDNELLSQIEKADSALLKAEYDFNIRVESGMVSKDIIKQFMTAKAEYFINSEEVKDSILTRSNPLFSIFSLN
jgi:predicted DNA binding CopG/RHH family protein